MGLSPIIIWLEEHRQATGFLYFFTCTEGLLVIAAASFSAWQAGGWEAALGAGLGSALGYLRKLKSDLKPKDPKP